MRNQVICLLLLATAAPALAEDKAAPAAGMPDMSKMGPMSRKVTKEDKKGVDDLYKAMDQAWKGGDVNALADLVDFPVIMLSDDSKGEVKWFAANREQWLGIMKGFLNMPKDMKMSHKHNAQFLSDDLAIAIEETTMTAPAKGKWKSFSVLTRKDGRWKVKQMCEAGWGDMKPPPGATTASAH